MPDTIIRTDGTVAAEISRRAVQILREYTGRGPTKAMTVLTKDTVAIILADTLTMGEQSLVGMGEQEHVLRSRRSYQELMRPDLVALIEEQTDRTVHAFFSDNQIGPDYGVEFFLLDPFPSAVGSEDGSAGFDGNPARDGQGEHWIGVRVAPDDAPPPQQREESDRSVLLAEKKKELLEFRDAGVLTDSELQELMTKARWGIR